MKTRQKTILKSVLGLIRKLSSDRPECQIVQLNSIWLLTLVVTIVTLAMFWIEFFCPAFHAGMTRSFIYYTLLCVYVIYKEVNRWHGRHEERRLGSIWLLIWWTSVFLMEFISFCYQEYYRPLDEQYALAIAVSINFLLSRYSKCRYLQTRGKRNVPRSKTG